MAVSLCLEIACLSDPRERALTDAYIGPAALTMRKELSNRSDVLAELKHGERVEVLQARRRFVKIRNLGGTEGWVDGRGLLTGEQMREMQRSANFAATLPSQGKATVLDTLNMHAEPNRQSPSPHQITPGSHVEVVGHTVARQVGYKAPIQQEVAAQRPPPPKKSKKSGKAKVAEKNDGPIPPPPMPAAPKLPKNWRELSRKGIGSNSDNSLKADDWTLVRSEKNETGWVLTRNLLMAIPDNIARYAAGARITSYFRVGEVKDNEEVKPYWLWTTVSQRLQPYQFDSFRVFIYSLKRHRYETAYRESGLRGYYPVTLETVEVQDRNSKASVQGFNLIVEDSEGQRIKRTYALVGNRVRLIRSAPVEKPAEPPRPPSILSTSLPAQPEEEDRSLMARIKGFFKWER